MRIFLAGGTGATGRVFVSIATEAGLDLVLHVRPKTAETSPLGHDPRAVVFDLADADALRGAMGGCDAVVSLVGTMRKRFDAGDTYESADIGSTRQLVDAAKAAGVPRFLLLSSVGAGGAGPYLKAKGECERLVRESGLRWTIFRPSALASPPGAPEGSHGRRDVPNALVTLGGALAKLPGVGPVLDDLRPIPLDALARAMVRTLKEPHDGRILMGRDLWRLA